MKENQHIQHSSENKASSPLLPRRWQSPFVQQQFLPGDAEISPV